MIAAVGRQTFRVAGAIGAMSLVAARTFASLPRQNGRELLRSLLQFGYGSLPVALLVAALTGALAVVQTGLYAVQFGARTAFGWAAGYAVLWEFGPLLLGLVLAARVGARNAAELATLSVNGQIEGLRGVGLDPYALLVAPRALAVLLSVALLSPLVFVTAVLVETVTAWATLKLAPGVFFASFASLDFPADVLAGLAKSVAYALAIALVSTTVGLKAQGGAHAVGRAAAAAVFHSCAAIFALDYLLTRLLLLFAA